MSYTFSELLPLASSKTGILSYLRCQPVNASFTAVGSVITTGFVAAKAPDTTTTNQSTYEWTGTIDTEGAYAGAVRNVYYDSRDTTRLLAVGARYNEDPAVTNAAARTAASASQRDA